MGNAVRPLVEEDLPAVAELHARVFGGDGLASPALRGYLAETFCHHPWVDPALPSLVYEGAGGRIAGVLGVMRRPMTLHGRAVQAAVGHDFMVDPGARAPQAAVELARTFVAGPQDLTLADGNASSRRIWEALGGTTSVPHSLRWTRPLRPGRWALGFLRRRGLHVAVAGLAAPWCAALDTVATRMPGTPFHQTPPRASGAELTDAAHLACLREFFADRALRPDYDARSLAWLLGTLGRWGRPGALRKVIVRNPRGDVLGWYLYYLRPRGVAEVVQIGATRESIGEVLGHLFFDAWRGGGVAVSGQLDPAFAEALSRSHCVFDNGGFWLLLHGKHPEALAAIHRGDAQLTRLEGEGWMRLAFPAPAR